MSGADYAENALGADGDGQLNYKQALEFPFASGEWIKNVALGSLCILSTQVIPVIGQLVWMGFLFEVIESLHRQPKAAYPDFDFNRFTEYLLRGFWAFLVGLVSLVVIVPLFGGLFGIGLVGSLILSSVTGGGDTGGVLVALFVMLMVVMAIVVYFLCAMFLAPLMLRAGWLQDFREAFDFEFAKDFVSRTWKEMVLAGLFSIAFLLVAQIVGLLACIVGVFPAVAIVTMTQFHLLLQIYEIYLARGGRPIPFKATGND